mmetsp:Transcript_5507/g.9355  ORF Transcript_5507/g.9355 Transcript_5507/m.9355 type:complete len:173 (+) Transcript_5507:148-666(+)
MRRNYELKMRAQNFPLPTSDVMVQVRLRQLGQPIQLFGEDAGMRRERLREVVSQYFLEVGESPNLKVFNRRLRDFSNFVGPEASLKEVQKCMLDNNIEVEVGGERAGSDDDFLSQGDEPGAPGQPFLSKGKKAPEKEEVFYTEGTPQLEGARLEIARYSIEKSTRRLQAARE